MAELRPWYGYADGGEVNPLDADPRLAAWTKQINQGLSPSPVDKSTYVRGFLNEEDLKPSESTTENILRMFSPIRMANALVPFGHDAQGHYSWSAPSIVADPVESWTHLVDRHRAGIDDPEADVRDSFVVSSSLGLGGLAATPMKEVGAIGTMGGRALKTSTDLPMDLASRMARAKEMGYDFKGFHGTAHGDFPAMKKMTWASETPDLANEYAAMRFVTGSGDDAVMPLMMKSGKSFDADALPKTVTAPSFLNDVVGQAIANGRKFTEPEMARLRELLDVVRTSARREESGPHYSRHDFWYDPESMFGKDGADAVREIFKTAGFDSVKMMENGANTLGVFDPKNVRSVNAAFDPAKSDSANLLAANPSTSSTLPLIFRGLEHASSELPVGFPILPDIKDDKENKPSRPFYGGWGPKWGEKKEKYADGGEVLDEKRFFTPRDDAIVDRGESRGTVDNYLRNSPLFGYRNPASELYNLLAPATETKSDRPMRYRVLDTLGAAVNLPVRMATLGEYNTADLVQGLTGRDFPAVRESEQRFYENNQPLMRPIQALGEALPFGVKGVPHIPEAKLRFAPLKDEVGRLVTDESGAVPLRLSALHNLSPENLTFTEKQGGLAVPSVGIVKEGMGLEGFGNISLIGRKPLGDPNLNPIFSSDAYSMRQPRALYRPVKEKVAQYFIDDLKPLFAKYGDDRTNWSLWDDLVNSPDLEKALRTLQDSPALQAKFLQEKGINVEPVITDSLRGSRAPWVDTKTFKEFISKNKNWDEDREILEKAASDAIDEYVSSKKTFPKPVSQEIKDDLREALKAKIPGSYTIREEANKIGKQEPDRYASLEKLKEPISKFGNEYKNWLHEKIAPMYGSPYLELGRKKVPYTLDNIVDAMTSGRSVKGQEKTMTYGPGKARAESARKFSNLEDMRSYADRDIKPREEVDQLVKESNSALEQYRDALLPYSKYPNATWENLDNSMRAISDISKKMNYTPQGLRQALSKYDFSNVPNDVLEMGIDAARKLNFAPVSYFESKPQRAVGLNEFAGAVVPKNISEDVLGILKRYNIPYEGYENLNRESQAQATADFAKRLAEKDKDVLFSKGGTVTDLPRLRPLN